MYVQLPLLVIAYGAALAAAECEPQTLGAGPPVRDPDTANAFYASTTLQNIAMNDPPLIYGYGSCFGNMTAAIDGANYLGYSNLRHFDPNWCAAKCDITPGCLGINLYMQRNPMLAPGPSCPDPPSTTVYRCGLWGKSVSVIPTNKGQTRNKFQVVIANSQGWNRYTSLEPGTGLSGPWRWAISGGARIGYVQKYLNVTVEPSSDGKPTRASLTAYFPDLDPAFVHHTYINSAKTVDLKCSVTLNSNLKIGPDGGGYFLDDVLPDNYRLAIDISCDPGQNGTIFFNDFGIYHQDQNHQFHYTPV